MFRSRSSYMALFVVCTFVSVPASAAVRYVKPTASGTGDCTSWANACTLASGLGGAQTGDELWVKSGTYAPVSLKNGVKVYGGFAGTEGAASQSNPAANATVINGGGTTQCVTGSDNAASTVLRGFTIQNGWDGGSDGGGGMVLENSSAVIVQCTFVNNKAANFGGAVSVRGTGSPQFINCIFEGNGEATGNDPLGGGVLYAYRGSPTFVNCLFNGNKAGEGGVALVYFGNPTFINCTFVNNQAKIGRGGAIYDPNGQATLKNCILWNNTTTRGVGEADQIGAGGGGRSLARYCDIQAGWPGTNIINADPMFTGDITQGYYTLQSGSPCKETGENAALPPDIGNLDWDLDTSEPIPLDLALHERASGPAVDMGAYEYFDIVPGGPE